MLLVIAIFATSSSCLLGVIARVLGDEVDKLKNTLIDEKRRRREAEYALEDAKLRLLALEHRHELGPYR